MPESAVVDVPHVTACTIVARNYLPAARVLAQSYLDRHPDHEFLIAVIDARDEELDVTGEAGKYRVVGNSAFGIDRDSYLRMATGYSVTELATSVKPYLLRELRTEADVAIYLDPDIQVMAPMYDVAHLANVHAVVLTPHFLEALPQDDQEPDDKVIMGTGIFNLGFIAVGPASDDFLDFWADRLRHDAIVAPEQQLFTDQRWVDQVPALFDHYILADRGYNVAYWNLHERTVARDSQGSLKAGGQLLRFFHFSGYRPEQEWLLTLHCARKPRVLLSDNPVLRELCDTYGAALRSAGYGETLASIPYGFATFPDGADITPAMRRLFRRAWMNSERNHGSDEESVPPPAFGPDSGDQLQAWLAGPATPAQSAAGLNRLTMWVWQERQDLQLAFPNPCGEQAQAFRSWCRSSGRHESQLPDWALPHEPTRPADPSNDFGVNLLGYLTAQLGLGEMGRIIHDTLEQAGIPTASVVEERSVSNKTGVGEPNTLGSPTFPITIFAVNADQTRLVLDSHPQASQNRYRIGLWAWELEDFPEWQHPAFDLLDEVWTVSEFSRTAIAEHSPVPVKTIPVPVRDTGVPLAAHGTSAAPTRFLFVFDYNSVAARKNPLGAVSAFQRAFPTNDAVQLSIKTMNDGKHPREAERLRLAVSGDERIELIERYLAPDELDELYAASDCYVSLHRSEGFGLTVAEAMARAMPVISTDYSGTSEFLDVQTGWPIAYRMTKVGDGCYPYHPEAIWADPDLDAAARAMCEVATDPSEARRRGTAARERILRGRSMRTAGDWMRTQLRDAHQTWLQRHGPTHQPRTGHPLTTLGQAREALRWRPNVHSAARNPLVPAVRKAILRTLDHYDVHQRSVLSTVLGATEDSLRLLLERIESLEATQERAQQTRRIEQLDGRIDTLASEVRKLRTNESERERSLSRLHDEHNELHGRCSDLTAQVSEVGESLEQHSRSMSELADAHAARDRRLDSDEHRLQQVIRDLDAVHESARQMHAPVPRGTDAVVCDAGTLLLPADDVVLPWIRHHRSWEPSEAGLMARLAARNGGTFVDIGAHVGYHVLRLLRSCPEVDRVVAVESVAQTYELLLRNITTNLSPEIAGRVHTIPAAAWDRTGQVRLLHEQHDNSGDHRVTDARDETDRGTLVPAVRLDETSAVTAQRVGLIKVDLQGRDHRALGGMLETLTNRRPDIVCEFWPDAIEQLGDDPAQVLAWYRELGYLPVMVAEDAPPSVDSSPGDDATNAELIDIARAARGGFSTLWLRPSGARV